MANIWQITWEWTGFPGANGYTNLFYLADTENGTEALAAATKSRLFMASFAGIVPLGITIRLVTDVRLLDETDGTLQNIFTVSGITDCVMGGVATRSAPSGGCVDWLTTTVHGTRRLQGRTFVVPLSTDQYQSDGSLVAGAVTALATGAETMRTASGPPFGVWGRPRLADPEATPPVTFRAGLWGPAVSSRVPDKSVILRSRRD
jgi:hypothetical protein